MENDNAMTQLPYNSTLNWILFILIVIGIMIGIKIFNLIPPPLPPSPPTNEITKQFEYKIEFLYDFNSEDELNKFGKEGWQVVGSRRATSPHDSYGYELIFMKEK
jgi:hypothetical protein